MLSRTQRIALTIGIVLLVVVLLCPPWSERISYQGGGGMDRFAGFGVVFLHPIVSTEAAETGAGHARENIHIGYLFAELFVVIAATAGAIVLFKVKPVSN